jgi:hypothetical protein
MIGPAEIEDMLADYEEASSKAGSVLPPAAPSWPLTLTAPRTPIPYEEALERIRRATTDAGALH